MTHCLLFQIVVANGLMDERFPDRLVRFGLMILFTLLVSFVGVVAGSDPCWFIGLRLAKTRSHCMGGMCTDIYLAEDGRGVFPCQLFNAIEANISCDHADTIALRLTGPAPHRSVPIEISRIEARLRAHVLPAIVPMLFFKRHLSSDCIAVMAELDRHLLQAYRSGKKLVQLVDSAAFHNFFVVWSAVIMWSHHVPFTVDVSSGLIAELIHFGMDILSVLGPQAEIRFGLYRLEPSMMAVATYNTGSNPVAYRRMYDLELALHFRVDIVSDPTRSVHFASAVTKLVQNPGDVVVGALVSRLVMSLHESQSATEALFRAQLLEEVCPHLDRLLIECEALRGFTKTAISLIHLCKPVIGERGAIEASISLVADPRRSIPESDLDELLAGLVDWDFAWIHGFSLDQENVPFLLTRLAHRFAAEFRPYILVDGVLQFRTRSHFESADSFERTMVGLGRMFALCTRYEVACRTELGLTPILEAIIERPLEDKRILDYIAPRFRTASPEESEGIIFNYIREPVFFISDGIAHVLGPAGIYSLRMH